MTKTRSLTIIIIVGFLASILCSTIFSFAESLTFTAYYPSPNAFYNNLNTTNLKVNRDAFVGGSLGVGTPIGDTETDIFVVNPADGATLLLYGGSDPADPNSNYANLLLASPGTVDPSDPYIWSITHSAQAGSDRKLGYIYHGSGQTDVAGDPIFINVLTMDTDGDVGVNTTDPRAALHVKSNNIIFEGHNPTGTNSPQLEFREDSSNSYWAMIKRGSNNSDDPDNLLFSYNADGSSTGWTEHMKFDTQGNVLMNEGDLNITDGNVTIGSGNLMVGSTGSNSAGLFVRSGDSSTAVFEGISSTSGGSPAMVFAEQDSSGYWVLYKRGSSYAAGGGPFFDDPEHLGIGYTPDGGTNWIQAIKMDSDGDIYLNDPGSSNNVTVYGSLETYGHVTVGNDLVATSNTLSCAWTVYVCANAATGGLACPAGQIMAGIEMEDDGYMWPNPCADILDSPYRIKCCDL